MPEIKEGDYLVFGAKQYAIRGVNEYGDVAATASMQRLARFTANVERRQQTRYAGVRITAIDPASELAYRSTATQAPVRLFETFVVADEGYLQLILEKTKQ